MSDEKPLPAGWYANTDPNTGNTYYYKEDGTTQWNFPEEEAAPQTESKPAPSSTSSSFNDQPAVTTTSEPSQMDPAQPQADSNPESNGKLFTKHVLNLALFPFSGTLNLIIYLAVIILLNLVELIIGFASLRSTISTYTVLKKDKDFDKSKTSFLQAYMIVDAFISLIDTIVHIFLMWGPAHSLLNNPQNLPHIQQLSIFPFSNVNVLFPSNASHRTFFLVRIIQYLCVNFFKIVWNIVALIIVAIDMYVRWDGKKHDPQGGLMFFSALYIVLFFCYLTSQICFVVGIETCKKASKAA